MATRIDECEPDNQVISTVVVEAIQPVLQTCEEISGGRFAATVTVWVQESPGFSTRVVSSGDLTSGSPSIAEIRLRFRQTFELSRLLFQAEAIFQDAARGGFTGFHIKGDVLLKPEGTQVRDQGGSYRYNVTEWQGWV